MAKGVPLDSTEAVVEMLEAGLWPNEPYTKTLGGWSCTCMHCGREQKVWHSHIRFGKRVGCKFCTGAEGPASRRRYKWAEDDAIAAVLSHGVARPVGPYPGRTDRKWLCECLICGEQFEGKAGALMRDASGHTPCILRRAQRARRSAQDPEVVRRLEVAGRIPLEDYPGNRNIPWKSKCAVCGTVDSPPTTLIYALDEGRTWCRNTDCPNCVRYIRLSDADAREEMRSLGFDPDPGIPYPGTNKPWPSKHRACGYLVDTAVLANVRLRVKGGTTGCGHCSRTCAYDCECRVDEGRRMRELFLARGIVPQTDYPGWQKPWPSVCAVKGHHEVSPAPMSVVRVPEGRSACRYCVGQRIHPVDAEAEMRAGFFEPTEPFRGIKTPWPSVHVPCGHLVTDVTLDKVRDLKDPSAFRCRYCPALPRVAAPRAWQPECSAAGCPNRALASAADGLCKRHSRRVETEAWALGEGFGIRPDTELTLCMIDGCASPAVSRGLCKAHNYDWTQREARRLARLTRDAEAAEAERTMRAAGFVPLAPFSGRTTDPWRAIHERCGNEVSPRYVTVKETGSGCRDCSRAAAAERRRNNVDACATPGCDRPSKTRGYCNTHYMHLRAMEAPPCCEPGCGKPAKTRGMCSGHYEAWRKARTGAPN